MTLRLVGGIVGAVIIIWAGLQLDEIKPTESPMLEDSQAPTKQSAATLQHIAQDTTVLDITVKLPVNCTETDVARTLLREEGLRVFSTGTSTTQSGDKEVAEVWLHPTKQNYAILHTMPKLGISCLLTAGPKMIPGEFAAETPVQKQKGKPL